VSDPLTAVPAPATMTRNGLRFLRALAAEATSGCYLEVGPLFGSSTQAIDAGRRRDAAIHTIDTFEPAPWIERRLGRPLSRAAFDRYTASIEDLVVHQGFAPDVVRDTWTDPIGFYFDDATHGDPGWTDNFEFFSRFFTDDAIVCGDDFAGGWPDIPHNVTRIAAEWGVGLYVYGRVWAMTRRDESRVVAAAAATEPLLSDVTVESAHGPEVSSNPGMVWSRGLHQRVPLSSFRYAGDAVSQVRFATESRGRLTESGPGDWVHVPGVSSIRISGTRTVGFQLCLATSTKTENTKLFRPGAECRIPPDATVVAVRLGTVG
jgi:hypothetical protein